MAARTWLPRLLIVALAAGLAWLALWLRGYMRPEAIRQQLLDQFAAKFPHLRVEIGSAHLKLFGGIAVHDLSLSRPNDPHGTPFLTIPSATLHPDKELLHTGKVVLRRVEIDRARLTVERGKGGFTEWADLFSAPDGAAPDQPPPAVVVRDARVRYVDPRDGAAPPLEAAIERAEVSPGPVGTTTVGVHGSAPGVGSFRLAGTYRPAEKSFDARLDLPGTEFTPQARDLLARVCPEAASALAGATGTVSAGLDLKGDLSGPTPKVTPKLDVAWRGGSVSLPGLNLPARNVEARATLNGTTATLTSLKAEVGGATVRLAGSMPLPKSLPDSPAALFASIPAADLTVEGLDVTADLVRRLPPEARVIDQLFAPRGRLDVRVTQKMTAAGVERVATLWPRDMALEYENFRYPIRDGRGAITLTLPPGGTPRLAFDGTATIQGRPLRVKGTASGASLPLPDLDITLIAEGIALDDRLIAALPDDYPAFVRRLGAKAEGDLVATIRRNAQVRAAYGPQAADKTFEVTIRRGSMQFEQFPYPLTDVSGRLVIKTLPDRPTQLPGSTPAPARPGGHGSIAFENFSARHGAGLLKLAGRRETGPGGGSILFDVAATDLDIDDSLRASLRALRLDAVVAGMSPEGRINAKVRAKILLREGVPFDPRQDLHVGLALAGLRVRPAAMPVTLTDLSMRMGYSEGRLTVLDVTASHGAARLTIPAAEVVWPPEGGQRLTLSNVTVAPLAFDAELLAALPQGVRRAVEAVRPRGRMALRMNEIGIDLPPERPRPAYAVFPVSYTARAQSPQLEVAPPAGGGPNVRWDGTLFLDDAALQTGVGWEGVAGEISCRGSYADGRTGGVEGNAVFREGRVLRQPIRKASARFEIDPRRPDSLTVPWINAELYGGEVGGQARVELAGPARFDLKLNATRVRLSELAKYHDLGPKLRLEGLATAELFLTNRDADPINPGPPTLQGSGSLKVADGKLLNLPLTLEILRALRGSAPDETLFEDASLLFAIRGDKLRIGQLDLIGKAVSLGGEGEIDLATQKVHLELYTVWSNLVRKVAAEPLEAAFAAMSKNLFKLKVDGTFGGALDVRKEMVPALVEPVQRLIGLVNGSQPAPPLRRSPP